MTKVSSQQRKYIERRERWAHIRHRALSLASAAQNAEDGYPPDSDELEALGNDIETIAGWLDEMMELDA